MTRPAALLCLLALLAFPLGAQAQLNDIDTMKARAAQGDPDMQNELGKRYMSGSGVPQDYAEALKWFHMAADKGFAKSQNNIGAMYAGGRGVTADWAEALKWYRLAADQGQAVAEDNLGNCYRLGHGVPQDPAEGVKWFLKSAGQGNPQGENDIAAAYRLGVGVEKNDVEAFFWLTLASRAAGEAHNEYLDAIAARLTQDQFMSLKKRLDEWKPASNPVSTAPSEETQFKMR